MTLWDECPKCKGLGVLSDGADCENCQCSGVVPLEYNQDNATPYSCQDWRK